MLDGVLRDLIFRLADSRSLQEFVRRNGRLLGVGRFVAGESFDEALPVLKAMNGEGLLLTLDALGEAVTEPAAAQAARDVYLEMLRRIGEEGLEATVSLKLTQMGLALDADLCRANVGAVVARAAELGNHVQIDMEDSSRTSVTLKIFEELHRRYGDHVGAVLQAYLYRSKQDMQLLAALKATVRIVKGAYREPPSVAFPRKEDVDRSFLELCRWSMRHGGYTCVATHDEALIDELKAFGEQSRIPRERFEFQMLYGIRPSLQRRLVAEGYRVRIYVPVGTEWYPYFMRRLAERPANLLFFLRNAVRR